MDALDRDELLGLAQDLGGEDGDGRRAVADLVVLDLGDVDEDLGGRVVEGDALEDGGAVVGDGDLAGRGRVEDLVHALGAEGRLDEVAEGEGADKGREAGLRGEDRVDVS